jgi:hypothetical protein
MNWDDPFDVFPDPKDLTRGKEFNYYLVLVIGAGTFYKYIEQRFYFDDKKMATSACSYLLGVYGGYDSGQITGLDELPEGAEIAERGDWY